MPTPMPDDWASAPGHRRAPRRHRVRPRGRRVGVDDGRQGGALPAGHPRRGRHGGVPPEKAGPLREEEERRSAAVVGVTEVEFLDERDGTLVAGPDLRRDLAGAIRRHRPELVVTGWFGPTWSPPGVSPGYVNSADHRALGQSVLDAVADAGNEWIFPDLTEDAVARRQVHRGERDARPAARGRRQRPRGEGGRVAVRAPPVPGADLRRPGRGAGPADRRHGDARPRTTAVAWASASTGADARGVPGRSSRGHVRQPVCRREVARTAADAGQRGHYTVRHDGRVGWAVASAGETPPPRNVRAPQGRVVVNSDPG